MTTTTTPSASGNRTAGIARLLCAAAAFLGTACSGAPDIVAVETDSTPSNGTLGDTRWTDPTVAPADDNHVRVIGMVEAISLDSAPGATGKPVAGAEVCLTTSGTTTCTTTGDDGTYAFEAVQKTAEAAQLIATYDGFATTVTSLSVETTVSHALGLVPASLVPSGDVGVVLTRSLLRAYAMTELVSGIHVDVEVGAQTFSGTTQGNGSTLFSGVVPGPVTVRGSYDSLSCGLWVGNSSATINTSIVATAGVVTQVDVLCNVDANDNL